MPLRCPAPDYNLSLRSASPSFRRASIHYPRLFFCLGRVLYGACPRSRARAGFEPAWYAIGVLGDASFYILSAALPYSSGRSCPRRIATPGKSSHTWLACPHHAAAPAMLASPSLRFAFTYSQRTVLVGEAPDASTFWSSLLRALAGRLPSLHTNVAIRFTRIVGLSRSWATRPGGPESHIPVYFIICEASA